MAWWRASIAALASLVLTCCGRLHFDALADAGSSDTVDGAGALAWQKTFVAHQPINGSTTDTFIANADHPGDAIIIQVECDATSLPPSVQLAAPGWTPSQLGTIVSSAGKHATMFAAIAPDTAAVTFTVTWGLACSDMNELGDEFTNTAASPFGAIGESGGSGSCIGGLATTSAGAAIWAACSSAATITGAGQSYTKSADDGHDDWSEFRLTADPIGTMEFPTFEGTGGAYVVTIATISPR